MKRLAILAATGIAIVGSMSTAHADLTIQQTLMMSGEMQMPGQKKTEKPVLAKTTTYYKGEKQRVDSGDSITITEAGKETITILNPHDKTYYEMPILGQISDAAKRMQEMVAFGGTAEVSDTGEEKQIAGVTAHHYKYAMSLVFTIKDPNAPPILAAMIPSFAISGDEWTVPSSDTASMKLRGAAMMRNLPPGMGQGLKPLIDKMTTIKGVAVAGTQTIKIVISPNAPDEMREQAPKQPYVIDTKADIINAAPLSDTLFTIPEGYRKIAAPTESSALPSA